MIYDDGMQNINQHLVQVLLHASIIFLSCCRFKGQGTSIDQLVLGIGVKKTSPSTRWHSLNLGQARIMWLAD